MINCSENRRDDKCFRNLGEGAIFFPELAGTDTMGVAVPFPRGLVGLRSQGAVAWGTHDGRSSGEGVIFKE